MRRLDIISDAICPWCWIGKAKLDRALAELGGEWEVHWRPFQLNPDMPPEGVPRAEYRAAKFGSVARGAELDAQVVEAGRMAGVEFRHDRMARTPNTVQAHRLVRHAAGPGQHALVEALFRAYFHDGEDVGDAAVLTRIGEAYGIADAAALLAGDALEAEVRAEDAQFRRMGISGVPSVAVDGRLAWSGAQPPERIIEALGGQVGWTRG